MTSDRLRAYWSAWSALSCVLGCWRAYLTDRNDSTRAAPCLSYAHGCRLAIQIVPDP